jgi:hypothetical protein
MTKEFLKQYIVGMLGGSQTDVELADSDLDMIIYHTINYYGHNSSEAWNEEWVNIPLKANENYHELADDIDFIITMNMQSGGSGQVLIPETTGSAYEITMLGMISNDNELTRITNPIGSRVIYRDGKRWLQTDMTFEVDTVCAAKVMRYKDLAPIYSDPWVQKYALAQAKFNLGLIRSKFSNITSPADASMNGSDLMSQAQTEIERLETELFDKSVLMTGGIYIG